MEVPALDRRVGILVYLSHTPGIGGEIKREVEDFLVEEILPDGRVLEIGKSQRFEGLGGEYTHFTLEKRNWDTLRAVREIAKSCGVSRKRIKFAGTKDRRAITTQRMSIWRVPKEKLGSVRIRDITLRDFSKAPEPVRLGGLAGNRFTVVVRNPREGARALVRSTIEELGGRIPNFFGRQRFGARANNHEIGRLIVKGEFEEAVLRYLCDSYGEPEEAREARNELRESLDFGRAFQHFPKYLGFEKSVLNRLARNPTDYIGGLRALPKKLRWLFVHSYQAYLFNLALSRSMGAGEIPKSITLPGYEVKSSGVMAEVLEEEGVQESDFRINSMPEMSMRGEERECLVSFSGFELLEERSEGGQTTLRIRFSLPPGSYATVLLREIMKA